MWTAIRNCWRLPELRKKILFTAGIIVIVRMAACIPCPGINSEALRNYTQEMMKNADPMGTLISMVSMFSGGAIENFSIAALGIMPYITASIIIQLMMPVLPWLEKLQREGEHGRQKIQQYTRYFTLAICVIQGVVAAFAILDPSRIQLPAMPSGTFLIFNLFDPGAAVTPMAQMYFVVLTTIVLSAGAMVYVWLGERITEKGIGNGASLIITIGIISRLPSACMELFERLMSGGTGSAKFGMTDLYILLLMFGLVTAFAVVLTQGVRQVPIQMAKRMVGQGRGATGTSTYLPLKVNYAGIMPIIFGGALLQVPPILINYFAKNNPDSSWLIWIAANYTYGSPLYTFIYALMIIIFCYFWVANQFNPLKISDSLKRDEAYIPGIRPGMPTAEFLDSTMTRLTFAGSLMLTLLAVLPMIMSYSFNVPHNIATFFGGTSLLIAVGVTLDTLNQIESHLVTKNYDGFLKSGRIRGRSCNC